MEFLIADEKGFLSYFRNRASVVAVQISVEDLARSRLRRKIIPIFTKTPDPRSFIGSHRTVLLRTRETRATKTTGINSASNRNDRVSPS